MEAMTPYRQALDWLFAHANYELGLADAHAAARFNLERMQAILPRLGNPQTRFQSIHLAGTKGKGSTAAIVESILRRAGYKTGLYTSPHLHSFRERIRVGGELIPEVAVVEGVARLQAIQPDLPEVTVFEWMTALAFDYFARSRVDSAVVEVGLGGRLDSTNILLPRVAVITSISFDHMAVLGNTLGQIAREKAGIIKPGVAVVSAPQHDEALQVILQTAGERNAPVILVGRDWSYVPVTDPAPTLDGQEFEVTRVPEGVGPSWRLGRLVLQLLGPHQLKNAVSAIAAIHILAGQGTAIAEEAVREGVAQAHWPGRFEVIQREPYIVLDGAHNRESVAQLVATMNQYFPSGRVTWIFGTLADKDIRGMLSELVRRESRLIVTRPRHPRSAAPQVLAQCAVEAGVAPVIVDAVSDALAIASTGARPSDVTVVTGSVAFTGEARRIVLTARGESVPQD